MSQNTQKLYLVDVSSMFFRAFYAVRPLTAPSGLPTNAIFGFLSMTLKLLKEERPTHVVFCYDRKDPSFRKDLYTEYKANRSEMPDDLEPQIPYIKKLADLLGIPSIEKESFEADDLIGTLVKVGRRQKMEVFIVSGDKDFGQLIEEGVFLYDTMKNVRMGPAQVMEKWGVPPEQFIDYLAIVGDSSDNVPGVKGIGPKGAQKLLQDFGTLEGIYKNLDKISSASIKEKLITNKEMAFLSRKLVTIVTDIKLSEKMEDYKLRGFQWDELNTLFQELNFKNFDKTLRAIQDSPPIEGAAASAAPMGSSTGAATIPAKMANPYNGSLIEKPISIAELEKVLQSGQKIWGFLSEQGLYLSDEKNVFIVEGNPDELGKLCASKDLHWQGYDLKNLWHFLKIPGNPKIVWDSMLAAYVLRPGESMGMDQVFPKWTGELIPELPSPAQYCESHFRLAKELQKRLAELGQDKIAAEIEFPTAPVLFRMEQLGVALDKNLLAIQSKELAIEVADLEKQIHEQAGGEFNVGSPKQLAQILFEKLKLPPSKKTKTGYSTDNDVLEKLKKEHPIADLVLSYRELTKLKSTYVDALPLLVKEDGRIHSKFNQAHTTTGRLSSTDPNLQNIPIRTPRGERVRRAFIAAPGRVLLSIDYSQIELRVLAHFCNDKNLCEAFKNDLDIHAATAAEVFQVELAQVTSEQRRTAKAVNFGIAYGQGAFGLAETLGISRTESSQIIKRYFERFANVKQYIDSTIMLAKEQGFVETLYGRRRYLDELRSNNVMIQKFGERAAINAPIQGTASDIVKKAMIEVAAQVPLDLILQVHDELIFEGTPTDIEKYRGQVVKIMESVAPLRVPLKVNSAVGPNWDEAH
jgi:DNA polymerase-1